MEAVQQNDNVSAPPNGDGESFATVETVWKSALVRLQGEMDSQIYFAYLDPLKLRSFDRNCSELVVSAPSRLLRDQFESNYRERVSALLAEGLSLDELRFKVVVEEGQNGDQIMDRSAPYVVVKRPRSESAPTISRATGSAGLNPKYTFDNFVVGNSNQFCHAAARQVAEEPGKTYNPLFIYGGVGLGKTHLLHAIGNQILQRNPNAAILYMSAETFMNDLIKGLRLGKMEEFKNRIRSIETLLIDDIQFISGKERTQEEFFHTFNALHHGKRQIVITSDKIPQEIAGLEDRLKTRFAWGLSADLQAPDFETRVAILNRRATLDGYVLPQNVAHYIGENISSNVRELEGALTRLHAVGTLKCLPITVALAEEVLKPFISPKIVNVTVDDIKKVVATHFNLKVSDLSSKRRTRNLSFPRHIAMYLCRKFTTASYPEIGDHFGGRDHSSVIHAANVVTKKLLTDARTKDYVTELERLLRG